LTTKKAGNATLLVMKKSPTGGSIMNFKKLIVPMTVLALVFLAHAFQSSLDYKVLFEKAKFTMETKGDLMGAVKLFNELIAKYPQEREYAAKSKLYIGLCYEKKGLDEARQAFQSVINDYPEQIEIVKKAREKLSLLSSGRAKPLDSGMRIRQVWAEPTGYGEIVSPDGRYLGFTTGDKGNIAIYDVETGKVRELTHDHNYGTTGFGEGLIWSPDGRHLVYCFYGKDGNSLRVISVDGGPPRILYDTEDTESVLYPADWSWDGKTILVGCKLPGIKAGKALVSVADCSIRVLSFPSNRQYPYTVFCPDGNYILTHTSKRENVNNSGNRDIFLVSIDGKKEVPLVQSAADEWGPFWTPDGNWILFKSDRSGTTDLWGLRMDNLTAMGEPELIRKNIGSIRGVGLSQDLTYFYRTGYTLGNIYTAEIDFNSGHVLKEPQNSARMSGFFSKPGWSADGKFLAYFSYQEKPDGIMFVVKNTMTGEERRIPMGVRSTKKIQSSTPRPTAFPGGNSFLIRTRVLNDNWGYFSLDAKTGKKVLLFEDDPDKFGAWPTVSVDGKKIYTHSPGSAFHSIQVFDLDLKKVINRWELPKGRVCFGALLITPMGDQIIVAYRENEPNPGYGFMKMSTSGGNFQDLFRLPDGESLRLQCPHCLLPGSQSIFFSTFTGETQRFWLISAESGLPRELDLNFKNSHFIFWITIHPNGREIAFVRFTGKSDIMAMKNFMPEIR
jgi:Tol biopolymer transport system component